ncbi:MAG: ATP-binding protein [Solirubrobacteraceae bacterium]
MSIWVDDAIEGSNVSVEGRCRNASGGSDAFHRSTKGKARPSVRPKNSRKQDNRTRRPRLSAVAAQLAATRDESTAVGQASQFGVAARNAHELSAARRENAALRRENAALRSKLGAGVEGGGGMTGDPPNGPGFIEIVDLDLPGGPSAPGRARSEIRHATEAVLAEDDSATATLLTSELVTNAVIHPEQPDDTSIGLRIIPAQGRLRVEVTDSGSGFDPATLAQEEPESGGRGLLLVGRLSDRWGTTRQTSKQRQRFCVWFELKQSTRYSRRIAAHA